MNKVFGFLSGAIMGFLVGGTLSLLLAPDSGEDFRSKLQERTQRIQDEVKNAAYSRRIELEQQLSALRESNQS